MYLGFQRLEMLFGIQVSFHNKETLTLDVTIIMGKQTLVNDGISSFSHIITCTRMYIYACTHK